MGVNTRVNIMITGNWHVTTFSLSNNREFFIRSYLGTNRRVNPLTNHATLRITLPADSGAERKVTLFHH